MSFRLIPSESFRSSSVASGGGASPEFPPKNQLKLRRVFTTHACRRRRQDNEKLPHWRMSSFVKKPLGVANSVPLGLPANLRFNLQFLVSCFCSSLRVTLMFSVMLLNAPSFDAWEVFQILLPWISRGNMVAKYLNKTTGRSSSSSEGPDLSHKTVISWCILGTLWCLTLADLADESSVTLRCIIHKDVLHSKLGSV